MVSSMLNEQFTNTSHKVLDGNNCPSQSSDEKEIFNFKKGFKIIDSKRKKKRSKTKKLNITVSPTVTNFGNDIRREYGIMWRNVYNSCDLKLMKNFMDTYYHPEFYYIQRKKTLSGVFKIIIEIIGIASVGNLWFKEMNRSPDLRCELLSNELEINSDGNYKVTANIQITGTSIKPINYKTENNHFYPGKIKSTPDWKPIKSLSSFSNIHPFEVEGVMTMYLDSDCRIYAMDLIVLREESNSPYWGS